MDSRYITSAAKAEQLPEMELPEYALIGRSNTGKSSLINSLLQRRNLARTSRTPGRTQMVNFFSVNDTYIVADLPGYGYSRAQTDISKHWQRLIEAYLRRPNIKEFLFLHDSRRTLTQEDLELAYTISRQLPPLVILTKCDKLSRSEIAQTQKKVRQAMEKNDTVVKEILPCSSLKGTGIESLRRSLFERTEDD